MGHTDYQRVLSYIEQDITRKQVLGGNKAIPLKESLALTIRKAVARTYYSNAQNCCALLSSLHPGDHDYIYLITHALAQQCWKSGANHSLPRSPWSLWPAAGIASSCLTRFSELTQSIRFVFSANQICQIWREVRESRTSGVGPCQRSKPEVAILAADQKERSLWGREWGQTTSTSFQHSNIPENKRNAEMNVEVKLNRTLLNSLNIDSTSFQHVSTHFNSVERGWQTLSTFLFNTIEAVCLGFFDANYM